jgi:hypothetical protein
VAALISIRYRNVAQDDRVRYWSIADPKLWVIVYAFYMLLTNLWAASLINAIQVTLLEISALLLFVVVSEHAGRLRHVFVPAFLLIGIALFVYGMGAGVNFWTATDAVYGQHLLASEFEYHNTFGAFMLAVGIVAYFAGTNYAKWWMNILGAAAFMVSIVGVLGSYSRVVWVLAPIAYIVAFIIKPIIQKSIWPAVSGVVLTLFAGGSAYFALKALTNGIGTSFIYSLVVLAVAAVLVSFAEKWTVNRHLSSKVITVSVAAFVIIVGMLAVLLRQHLMHTTASITARISSISLQSVSLQERFYYYKNALHMWANAPILGGGGGTWTTKFQSFQTIPYWSTQAHSNVIDHLLNGGIIGFLLWLGLLLLLLVRMIHLYKESTTVEAKLFRMGVALAGLFMFGHAVLDFDFSFGYYQYIFWTLMAFAAAPYNAPYTEQSEPVRGVAIKWVRVLSWVTGIGIAILGISLGSAQLFGQNAAWIAPYDASLQLSLAQSDMQSAVTSHDQTLSTEAWNHLQSAAHYGRWDPTIQTQSAVMAYQMRHMTHAVAWADQAYQDAPFNSVDIRNMLGIKLWYGASIFPTQRALATAQLEDIITKYNDFSSINAQINYKLFADATPVTPDASMQVYIGAANYFLSHYQASLNAMNPLLSTNRDQAAINLYEIITVLDHQKMHAKPTAQDAQFLQQIKSSPSATGEYQYILKQSQ